MVSDFPRTLCLLRQEKKISQRKAAGELGVSQALLSHYENGVREPGLAFVVRAADYYGVSADFLLGRTMARDGGAILAEDLTDSSEEKTGTIYTAASFSVTSPQSPHRWRSSSWNISSLDISSNTAGVAPRCPI